MMNNKTNKYNEPWIEQRADPYVYKHVDGYYYFTASVPEYNKIIIRKAKSLDEMPEANEVVIWEKHDDGPMSLHIWAPEIHYIMGAWYIYFAAGDKDDAWAIRPYVLKCDDEDPTNGKWIELGKMQAADGDEFSFKEFSLDATVFESGGEYYHIWAEKVGVGKMVSNLYIAKMESPNKLKTHQVLLTGPDYDWERVEFWVNEGPAVLKKNGKIFMTYSASATGSCYCMGMLTANEGDDLLDPKVWKKERYPVLKTDESKGIFGPGHNSFTTSKEGKDICIYHARPYEKIEGNPLYDPNRHAMAMEVEWTEDGIPVFNL